MILYEILYIFFCVDPLQNVGFCVDQKLKMVAIAGQI